jgi:hypothetical protein
MPPYHYLRYTWYEKVDLDQLKLDLSEFTVTDRSMPSSEGDISIYRNERAGIHCIADNLKAFLYQHKAVLYQKESAPFTERDLKLRKIVFETYPKKRSSVFDSAFQKEPHFDTIQSE